jgi:hypothetical protein
MYVGKTGEENRAGRDRGYRNHRVEGVNMHRLQLHIKPKKGAENCRKIGLVGASLEICTGDSKNKYQSVATAVPACACACANSALNNTSPLPQKQSPNN